MKRKIGMIALAAMGVLTVVGCRPPENTGTIRDREGPKEATKQEYLMKVHAALELEDILLSQLSNHAKQFDLEWPFGRAQVSANYRLMKLKYVLEQDNYTTMVKMYKLEHYDTVEAALKADAKLQMEILKLYEKIKGDRELAKFDNGVIAPLAMDAKKTYEMLEKHDGVPVEKLKEYQEKKIRKREQPEQPK